MSENDIIHLKSHFKNWKEGRGQGLTLEKINPFLYYCVEQFTKPFDLNDEEIIYGITDGPSDGGVDAIYFLVNGSPVNEETELSPSTESTVTLLFFQVKEARTGFKATDIDKFYQFTEEYLDLSKTPDKSWSERYNQQILLSMKVFKKKYLEIIDSDFPSIEIHYYYITQGDELEPHRNAECSASRVREKASEHFSDSKCKFHFINLQDLLSQIQVAAPTSRLLDWSDLIRADDGFIGVVGLNNFYEFIRDDDGSLSQRIFEANVRGWQQNTPVNRGIKESLERGSGPNFWLLNNGITVLSTKAETEGKNRLKIKNPQIVNGLQTSRAIYSYFSNGNRNDDSRGVLVRVIATQDERVYGEIVKATNSQNKMEPYSLRAHDKIHVQIEEVFKQYDFFYDRRKGHYKSEGKPIQKIISPKELAQAVAAALLSKPDDARARPGKYWKDPEYEKVFCPSHKLPMFLSCIKLSRIVTKNLQHRENLDRGDINNIKSYVVMVAAHKALGQTPTSDGLSSLDVSSITEDQLEEYYRYVWKHYKSLGGDDTTARGSQLVSDLLSSLGKNSTNTED